MKRKAAKILSLTLAMIIILSMVILPAGAAGEYDLKLTLVHTNDVHSNVDIEPYVKGYADQLRAQGENVLIISAGDAFAGTSFASMSAGLDVAVVMNMVGYEMMAIGNHEHMMDDITAVDVATDFPFLGANANDDLRQLVDVKDYVIKEVEGVKIAFIGMTVGKNALDTGDEIVAAAEAAKTAAEAEGATVFIGVTHLGVTDTDETIRSTYLAKNCQWLTAIIDAHCHTQHDNGIYEENVLIAETGEYGNNIGVVELYFKDGAVVEKAAGLIPVKGYEDTCGITPDAEVAAFIAGVRAKNDIILKAVVANFPVDLDGERATTRKQETVLGDVLTDAMRQFNDVDVALVPASFIRASVAAGDMTRETFMSLLLFTDAPTYLFSLTGEELVTYMEESLEGQPEISPAYKQLSGLIITFDETKEPGSRIVSITLADGSELDPEASYRLAVTDMTIDDFYGDDAVEGEHYTLADITINQAFLDYLNGDYGIVWETDGRISSVNGTPAPVPVEPELAFSDIADSWAKDTILAMAEAGLVNGYEDGTFRPDNSIARAEMVKLFLAPFAAVLTTQDEEGRSFGDVPDTHWAYDDISLVASLGIVLGNERGDFLPGDEIIRQDAAVIIYRLLDSVGVDLTGEISVTYADAQSIDAYAQDAVEAMAALGIMTGKQDNMFAPTAKLTRAEAVTILARVIAQFAS